MYTGLKLSKTPTLDDLELTKDGINKIYKLSKGLNDCFNKLKLNI